jgi:homopolymeric O-antigen transport system permease protein
MSAPEAAVTVEPPQRWPRPQLTALWRSRELIYFLVWRDVKVRYKQTTIGIGWAIIQPVVSMTIFTLFFGKLAGLPSNGVPYPIFVLAGLIPWNYFASAVSGCSNSLVRDVSLISKVYFPRTVLPMASVLTGLLDLAISLGVLAIFMAIFRIPIRPTVLLVLPLVFFLIATALSVGIWFAAINVRYRDVGYVVPFFIQVWLFLTPVIYPASLVPEGPLRILYALNPMVGVVVSFRWALVGGPRPGPLLLLSVIVVLLLLLSGWINFMRTEQSFADVI